MESRKEQLFHASITIQFGERDLKMTTAYLVPSALSTAQMLEFLRNF